MPHRRRRRGRKTKFVTKRGLPFQMMKYVETNFRTFGTSVEFPVKSSGNPGEFFIDITNIPLGTDRFERIGNMVQARGFFMRIIFEAALAGTAQYIRISFTTPRLIGDTLPPITDMVTQINPETHKVWYDKTHYAAFQSGTSRGVVEVKKRFRPYMKLLYEGPAGDDITKGQIDLTIISKVNDGVNATLSGRLYYKDM